jgi:peptide/nickel transport system ATP-binding protein
MDICREVDPPPFVTPEGTIVACHLHTSGPVLAGNPVTFLRASGVSPPSDAVAE